MDHQGADIAGIYGIVILVLLSIIVIRIALSISRKCKKNRKHGWWV